ncbi:hypothetical protein N177_1776 [Lutibaculum baratangense AMV1]|uniref:Uncharacterized protein n=1 Tax=Lutibaculum baratangense AMV1 TaxID=631454 RepID=V4RIV6_9HYPH|nr:hypothetical protein N177_1776 [Lutibaculum baratangense AMV1]
MRRGQPIVLTGFDRSWICDRPRRLVHLVTSRPKPPMVSRIHPFRAD